MELKKCACVTTELVALSILIAGSIAAQTVDSRLISTTIDGHPVASGNWQGCRSAGAGMEHACRWA